MSYFQTYLSGDRRYEDIDISVHCDVHIFEWLMEYIHQPHHPPYLEASSVISILISADFLQMHTLVRLCLDYLKQNINDVVRLPIDLGCLNDDLLVELAKLFMADELERIRDKKDKLLSRLYQKKLDVLLAQESSNIHRCTLCQKLFTTAQREWETCPKAPVMIDFHGNVLAEHVPNRSWDLHKWAASLRRGKTSARELYWKIWGLTNFLTCLVCSQQFPLAEMDHCTYHPQEPTFTSGDNCGCFPCCGQTALRFDLSAGRKRGGCRARRHTPDIHNRLLITNAGGSLSRLLETAVAHADLVFTPFTATTPNVEPPSRSVTTKPADDGFADGSGSEEEATISQLTSVLRGRRRQGSPHEHSDGDDELSDARASDDDSDADVSDSDSDANSSSNQSDDSLENSEVVERSSVEAPGATASRSTSQRGGADRERGMSAAEAGRKLKEATKAPKGSWHLDQQLRDDELRIANLSRALELRRRDAGPVCKDGPTAEKAPSLSGPKAYFLDRRFILQLVRHGAVSVLVPRNSAGVVARRTSAPIPRMAGLTM